MPDPADPRLYHYAVKECQPIDGDTFDGLLDLGFRTWRRERFRVLGINAPEIHGESKAAGEAATQFARQKLLGGPVLVRTVKQDSFGRWLAGVTLADGTDLAQAMIQAGHAVPFMVDRA